MFYLFVLLSILSMHDVLGQDRYVTGQVVDESNIPLPGVTVAVKGTQRGAQTDFDGIYVLPLKESDVTLELSYLGYKRQEVEIGTRTEINIAMEPDVEALGEIVVVGYGTQKKESVVGAIGVIKGDDLTVQGNISNLTDALTGQIPGLSVLSVSGMPGADSQTPSKFSKQSEILIRGKTTWNNSGPLILVDGVERDMNNIDVSEVESISVLKDASATAVFGVKGGNGVILITTKRGKAGKSKFSIQAEMSFETPSDQIETVNVPESATARNIALERTRRFNQGLFNEIYLSDEEIGYYRDGTYPYAYQNINWQDLLYKDFAQSYRVNATASGGSEKVQYFASASYNHVGDLLKTEDVGQGYVPAYSYDRINVRSNFDFQLSKSTKLAANFNGIYGVTTSPPPNAREGLFSGTSQYSGDSPILQYEDGVYGTRDARFRTSNPYFELNFNGVESNPVTTINMDYVLTQELEVITKGLQFTGRLAYDNTFRTRGKEVNDSGNTTKIIGKDYYLLGGSYDFDLGEYTVLEDGRTVSDFTAFEDPANAGVAGFGFIKEPNTYDAETVRGGSFIGQAQRNLYYEAALRYNRSFDKHSFTGLAMFSRQFRERGSNFPEKREDWVGRVTYDFDSKYFIEVNGSYNGSEKFGPGFRFDFFSSGAVGWMISEENFLKDVDWLDRLKVRYSYGTVGNDRVDTGSTWPYLTLYEFWGWGGNNLDEGYYGYPDGYTVNDPNRRYEEGNPGNPNLRWEIAVKQNLGFDFAAFNNKLNLTVELFKEEREDMLLGANERQNTVPPLFGRPAPAANVGRAKSHGAEVLITYRNTINNELNYWVSANWAVARSEVIFRESTELTLPHQRPEGFPIDQTFSPLRAGFINSWDDLYSYTGGPNDVANENILPGDIALIDFNSDGRYDGAYDNPAYGYPTYPQNNFGFSFGGDFKGFDLTILFAGAYNATRRVQPSVFLADNLFLPDFLIGETWSPEYNNSNPGFPALSLDSKLYTPTGEFHEKDGSFIRLQSAQIGYSLPQKWVKPLGMSNFKFYVNGRNLFLITNMPDDGVGLDRPGKNYPTRRQVNIGLNAQF
ncbi:SusC/RagA family TonB-linked outer membrane protein [Polaribacter filamentus]|nr:TonB-dependent receptor [Polaribacter filamentus]